MLALCPPADCGDVQLLLLLDLLRLQGEVG